MANGGLTNPFSAGAISYIPSRVASTTKTPTVDPVSTATKNPVVYSTKRLLLVEDNFINQKVATLMLKHLGYTADIANNGVEAIHAIERQQYDLLLMDCLMPEMDGLEATRTIRARNDYGAIVPIIAMTANAFAEDRQACLAAGMNDYIAKPVRETELKAKLHQWLNADK